MDSSLFALAVVAIALLLIAANREHRANRARSHAAYQVAVANEKLEKATWRLHEAWDSEQRVDQKLRGTYSSAPEIHRIENHFRRERAAQTGIRRVK
jgi:uncharacterized membrane protein